jgi:hypothetical protein
MANSDRDLRLRRYEVLLAKCGDKELVESLDLLLDTVAEKLRQRARSLGTPAKRRARRTRVAAGDELPEARVEVWPGATPSRDEKGAQ